MIFPDRANTAIEIVNTALNLLVLTGMLFLNVKAIKKVISLISLVETTPPEALWEEIVSCQRI